MTAGYERICLTHSLLPQHLIKDANIYAAKQRAHPSRQIEDTSGRKSETEKQKFEILGTSGKRETEEMGV